MRNFKDLHSVRSRGDMGQIKRLGVLGAVIVLVGLAGCWKRPVSHPNVLILTVERLLPEDLSCSGDSTPGVQSGLDLVCEDQPVTGTLRSRHRHALPEMASFLFGSSPEDLKVLRNDAFVRADAESFAEKAFEKGWTTAFFGSSPMFMRRSGLAQGFEYFEESPQVEPARWGRRADLVVQNFLKWLADQDHESFYAVLTFSDLNFPWVKTTSLAGQERSRSSESQVESVFESWLPLFRTLRERGLWDDTWVVITGLKSRDDNLGAVRSGVLVKPPKQRSFPQFQDGTLAIDGFSKLFHRTLFQLSPGDLAGEANLERETPNRWPAGPFWISGGAGSRERSRILADRADDRPGLVPWALLEFLEQGRRADFIRLAQERGPADAVAYWERIQDGRRNQILQDPCLRMIDLKIFEGGGTKTCESGTLLALQEWMKLVSHGAEEPRLREARMRTLRSLHELRSIRRIHMINYALGEAYAFPLEIGDEILRTEMALRFPDLQSNRNWLEQAEQSLAEVSP